MLIEKVPIFEPGNSGFKNGNLSFILGSRKELRFARNRSFHVQLSVWPVTVVKFDILFIKCLPILAAFRKDDGRGPLSLPHGK